MDLQFSAEDVRFREAARDWLQANTPRERRPGDGPDARAFHCAWQRRQYDGGWAGVSWPAEYGGRGLTLLQQLIWYEEYARANAPYVGVFFVGLNHGGPTLIAKGTEAQKSAHLAPILRGDHVWCQGFSEPGAGSDLASLSTRGRVEGDHIVVSGQKIWTSYADVSDFQELLVRTDPTAAKHAGLSWMICDMRSPGIEVRPIISIAGERHFCEVFYDEVRIPIGNVVGGLGAGWSVANATLSFERGTGFIGDQIELARAVERLIDWARETAGPNGRPLAADEDVAQKLATARAEVTALRAMTYVNISRIRRSGAPGAEGSMIRLAYGELIQSVRRLSVELLGARLLWRGGEHQARITGYLESYRSTIAAGTAEIQRNIIGERCLGLPRSA
jgi:alkylation response protein AidB-like acyl-CoA dehydrogenase